MANSNKRIDITGKTFGQLTVLSELPKEKKCQTALWLCRCVCGNIVHRFSGSLRRIKGNSSCGCIKTTHKHGFYKHKFRKKWVTIQDRCYNKNSKDYPNYGGRGISVCEEWRKDFLSFNTWCEKHYLPNTTLDRVDNNGDYSPYNCKFSTSKQQCNNRRNNRHLEYNGVVRTLSEWATITGLKRITISQRIDDGWDIHDALTLKPLKNGDRYHKKNKNRSVNAESKKKKASADL